MQIYAANQEVATLTRPIENKPLYIMVHCSWLNFILQEKNQLI